MDNEVVWDEWARITRFMQGALLAFQREKNLWESLEISGPIELKVTWPKGHYEVSLENHIAAVEDDETLFASVLIHSYALVELAAADHLGVDAREFGGIEDWGLRLLEANGKSWSDLEAGLGGAVEVAVIRNAFAHGTRVVDGPAATRLAQAGITSIPCGMKVAIDYEKLQKLRARLRYILNLGGIMRASRS